LFAICKPTHRYLRSVPWDEPSYGYVDEKDAAKDSGIKKDSAEHGHVRVTDVTMVSDACRK
jgi:hypothetical protein